MEGDRVGRKRERGNGGVIDGKGERIERGKEGGREEEEDKRKKKKSKKKKRGNRGVIDG